MMDVRSHLSKIHSVVSVAMQYVCCWECMYLLGCKSHGAMICKPQKPMSFFQLKDKMYLARGTGSSTIFLHWITTSWYNFLVFKSPFYELSVLPLSYYCLVNFCCNNDTILLWTQQKFLKKSEFFDNFFVPKIVFWKK